MLLPSATVKHQQKSNESVVKYFENISMQISLDGALVSGSDRLARFRSSAHAAAAAAAESDAAAALRAALLRLAEALRRAAASSPAAARARAALARAARSVAAR